MHNERDVDEFLSVYQLSRNMCAWQMYEQQVEDVEVGNDSSSEAAAVDVCCRGEVEVWLFTRS